MKLSVFRRFNEMAENRRCRLATSQDLQTVLQTVNVCTSKQAMPPMMRSITSGGILCDSSIGKRRIETGWRARKMDLGDFGDMGVEYT